MSNQLTVFDPTAIRASVLFKQYPWMTNIVLTPGSLEDNVTKWLRARQNVPEDQIALCQVSFNRSIAL
jgi:hypothetical protein